MGKFLRLHYKIKYEWVFGSLYIYIFFILH